MEYFHEFFSRTYSIFFSDYGVTKRHSRSEDANERNSGPM